jgi:serine protease Do
LAFQSSAVGANNKIGDAIVIPRINSERKLARRLVLLAGGVGLGAASSSPALARRQTQACPLSPSLTLGKTRGARPVFADIVEEVKPAVVSVRVRVEGSQEMMGIDDENGSGDGLGSAEDFFRRFSIPGGMIPDRTRGERLTMGQGSGFFISADGYAVTNAHVVDTAEGAEIMTQDGNIYIATVIGTDPKTELALIEVDQRADFPFVKLADGLLRVGDRVFALGNPLGIGGTATTGIVSARKRDIGASPYDDFIQIDARVNVGNSGSPAFDVDGNVVAVNTAIICSRQRRGPRERG